MADKNSFDYTYSAEKQEEIASIRRKYGLDDGSRSDQDAILDELRRLDASTTRPGTILGLTVGLIGTLVMGTGMSMAMVWSDRLFVQGIIVGVLGIAIVISAYPVYRSITEKRKAQNAPKIRELSDKLIKTDC